MASDGGLKATQEAVGKGCEDSASNSGGRTLMLITTGLCLAATGIVALSFESLGGALVLFGLAAVLIRLA
jgi:hypothetical protein